MDAPDYIDPDDTGEHAIVGRGERAMPEQEETHILWEAVGVYRTAVRLIAGSILTLSVVGMFVGSIALCTL